uniref:Steroid 5-alpha reductase C-terminal domain-containing protein n=1 Tax=Arcella intermedia TaxID=1963864 RepID=A0A6B2LQA5_9EUKA
MIDALSWAINVRNPRPLGTTEYIAIGLFFLGCTVETFSDLSRKWFKANPKNKGKSYQSGMHSLVQHPNYLGYLLWRAGMDLYSGNLYLVAGLFAMSFLNFVQYSIPALQMKNLSTYGLDYKKYMQNTKKIIPFIY